MRSPPPQSRLHSDLNTSKTWLYGISAMLTMGSPSHPATVFFTRSYLLLSMSNISSIHTTYVYIFILYTYIYIYIYMHAYILRMYSSNVHASTEMPGSCCSRSPRYRMASHVHRALDSGAPRVVSLIGPQQGSPPQKALHFALSCQAITSRPLVHAEADLLVIHTPHCFHIIPHYH